MPHSNHVSFQGSQRHNDMSCRFESDNNAWVVLYSLLSIVCWTLLRHSVQLSWTERVYSTQLNRGELNVCYSWVDPRLVGSWYQTKILWLECVKQWLSEPNWYHTANVLSGKIPEKNSVHLCTGILTGVIHVTNSTGKSRYFYFPTFYRSCQFQWKILSKTGFWSKAVTWISLIWQWIFPGKVSEFICILPWNTLILAGNLCVKNS